MTAVFEEKPNAEGSKKSNPVSRSTSNSSERMKSTSTSTTYADQPTTSRTTVPIEDGAQNFGYVCHSIKDSDIVEESLENLNNKDADENVEYGGRFSQLKRIISIGNQSESEDKINSSCNQIELADIPA